MEFKKTGEVRNWFEGQSHEVSVVMASRVALRVVPVLGSLFDVEGMELTPASVLLAVFRSLTLSSAAGKYPAAGKELAAYVADAVYAHRAATGGVLAPSYAFGVVYNAVLAAADSSSDTSFAFRAALSALAVAEVADAAALTAIAADASLLEAGMAPERLARHPLWPDEKMGGLSDQWRDLKKNLLALNEDWQVWTGWYEGILPGRNRTNLTDDLAEDLDLKIARQDNKWWRRDAAAVNKDIKDWTEEALEKAGGSNEPDGQVFPPPPEPAAGPGPQYAVLKGKLSEVAHLPQPDEVGLQAGLHRQIKKLAGELAGAVGPLGNRFPAFVNAAREYAALVASELDDLDVVAVWAAGGAMASFAQSYREQNVSRTLGEPLEPDVDAMLQSVVRVHGAFILGFAEGRDLVERADTFALDRKRLAEIEQPGNEILGELTDNRELVEERTRDLHRPVRDAVGEFEWTAGRNGYSGYLIVRNATRAIIKGTIVTATGIVLVQNVSAALGDPNMEFARAAIPFLQHYGSQLLIFFNHSPEMRAYVGWALKLLEADERRRRDDQD